MGHISLMKVFAASLGAWMLFLGLTFLIRVAVLALTFERLNKAILPVLLPLDLPWTLAIESGLGLLTVVSGIALLMKRWRIAAIASLLLTALNMVYSVPWLTRAYDPDYRLEVKILALGLPLGYLVLLTLPALLTAALAWHGYRAERQ